MASSATAQRRSSSGRASNKGSRATRSARGGGLGSAGNEVVVDSCRRLRVAVCEVKSHRPTSTIAVKGMDLEPVHEE